MPPAFAGDMKLTGVTWSSLGAQNRDPAGAWQPGQVYRARVEKVDADGAVLLRVGQQTLRVVTEAALGRGQELLLKMTTGGMNPAFSILRVTAPEENQQRRSPRESSPEALFVANTVQNLVSKQQPMSSLLRFLQWPADSAAAGRLLSVHLRALQEQFAGPADLVEAGRLCRAIQDSGLLLEPRLAAGIGSGRFSALALSDDLKLLLWQMLVRGAAGDSAQQRQLASLLEGVVAQLSLRQLHAASQAEQGHFHWPLELPVRLGQEVVPLSLTISREGGLAGRSGEQEASWHVEFSLDLEPLGPLKVSLYIRQQRVSVSLEAARQETVQRLSAELQDLEQSLQGEGFSVEALLSRPMAESGANPQLAEFEDLLKVLA